jgi:hypothetical protein
MKVRGALIGLMILMWDVPAINEAEERLTLRVSPAVAFAPANLVVRTTVEPDPSNRSMEIIAESSEFYRSSEIQLDGESGPRTSVFQFRSLPSGEYMVKAILKGAGGRELASADRQVNVVESGAAAR